MKNPHSITIDDLAEFKSMLRSIEKRLESLQSEANLAKQWLRTEEAAKYLSLSPSQIHNLKVNGTITCSKLGGTNYYNKEEIDNYLKNQGGLT